MDGIDRERDYWGPERARYDDELDAWRARTAAPVITLLPDLPNGLRDELDLEVEAA